MKKFLLKNNVFSDLEWYLVFNNKCSEIIRPLGCGKFVNSSDNLRKYLFYQYILHGYHYSPPIMFTSKRVHWINVMKGISHRTFNFSTVLQALLRYFDMVTWMMECGTMAEEKKSSNFCDHWSCRNIGGLLNSEFLWHLFASVKKAPQNCDQFRWTLCAKICLLTVSPSAACYCKAWGLCACDELWDFDVWNVLKLTVKTTL